MKSRPRAVERAKDSAEIEVLRQKITDLVVNAPEKAAVILTEWIHRNQTQKSAHKKKAA